MLRFTDAGAAPDRPSRCWRWSALLGLPGCGYNDFQSLDEQVKRRLVGGAEPVPAPRRPDPQHRRDGEGRGQLRAGHARQVVEARAKATSIQATPELINDPAAFSKFQQAQGELSSA